MDVLNGVRPRVGVSESTIAIKQDPCMNTLELCIVHQGRRHTLTMGSKMPVSVNTTVSG